MKVRRIDAAGEPAHGRGIEPGQLRDARAHALDRRTVAFAAHQVLQVFARRVALGLAQRLAVERRVRLARGRRHRGKPRHPGERRVAAVAAPAEIDHRRDHHQAAHRDALLVELAGELRGAEAAIAFARDEFLRGLPSVLLDPLAHEGREHVDVAVDRPELLAHLVAARDEAAVAGADRIDEHQVGEVEPGLGIGHQRRRRRRHDVVERQAPRAHARRSAGRPRRRRGRH